MMPLCPLVEGEEMISVYNLHCLHVFFYVHFLRARAQCEIQRAIYAAVDPYRENTVFSAGKFDKTKTRKMGQLGKIEY